MIAVYDESLFLRTEGSAATIGLFLDGFCATSELPQHRRDLLVTLFPLELEHLEIVLKLTEPLLEVLQTFSRLFISGKHVQD